jgi:hypothetical protein
MTMVLRENAIQAHLMRWDDFLGRAAGELPMQIALPARSYRSEGAAHRWRSAATESAKAGVKE